MRFLLAASWWTEFWDACIDELKDLFGVFTGGKNIGDEIRHGIMQWKGYLQLGDDKLPITDAIIVMWIAVGLGILLFWWLGKSRKTFPDAKQSVMETIIGLLFGVCKDYGLNDSQAEKVVPMVGTIGIVLISCNVCSIFKLPPPAKNIAFTFSLALFAIAYVIFMSIRFVGLKGFCSSFVDPKPFMLPFKIIDFFVKPISLSLRLFGNVFGAFILMEFLSLIVPFIVPGVFSLWFDLMDGILQAVVFCYLTTSYIGEVVESAHAVAERKEEKRKEIEEKQAAKTEANVA